MSGHRNCAIETCKKPIGNGLSGYSISEKKRRDDPKLFEKWCYGQQNVLSLSDRVCANHFSDEMFVANAHNSQNMQPPRSKRLIPNAWPDRLIQSVAGES